MKVEKETAKVSHVIARIQKSIQHQKREGSPEYFEAGWAGNFKEHIFLTLFKQANPHGLCLISLVTARTLLEAIAARAFVSCFHSSYVCRANSLLGSYITFSFSKNLFPTFFSEMISNVIFTVS